MDQLTQHDPRRIGPFEVLGRLGSGGMGLVYLARSASGRRVAIKTVRAELAEDQLFRVRFTREVKAARAVSGFYTAAVVDADPRAAVPWLATAYVPAPSLEEIVNRTGPLPVQAVRWLAAGVAEALESIHSARLVHRDLKPSNVLVVEDGPRVIDFGIASGVSNTRLTMTNVAVGTPAYMSPEQAKDSRSVTGASDVFSLGSTLVFAATGHAPFRGANPVETVFMLLREGPNLAGLPDELRPLIEACMRKEAAERPSPADLQAMLAPHLYASSDDTGTVSAWLPPVAVELIDERSGRTRHGAGHVPPPRPLPDRIPPMPQRPPAPADRLPADVPVDAHIDPPVSELPPADPPVHLAGSVPIGPGPLAAEQKAAGFADGGTGAPPAGLAWSAPDASARLAQSTAPYPAPVPQEPPAIPQATAPYPAPLPHPQQPSEAAVLGAVGGERTHAAGTADAADENWRPWRFRMTNDVWGTPVVAGNRLYVTSFEVHALDVGTGQRQFKTSEVAWTMAVDAGIIHASDGTRLFAFDAVDGGPRGRITPGGWVYSLSAGGGMLIAGVRGGAVEGYDVSRGELAGRAWERFGAQTEFESAEAGPALIGGTVYFRGGGRLHALDARTGEDRWWHGLGDAETVAGGVPVAPVVAGGVLFLTVGSRVLALDAVDGTERWRFDAPAVFFAPPAVADGGVYAVDYLGTVYALDARHGGERWRVATEARQSVEPPLVREGLVHLGSGPALYTLDAAVGMPRWRFATQGDVVGSPVAADGRLHFGSKDHCLYTVDAAGGQLRWKLETGGAITGTPVVREGMVFACSKDRCVYALHAGKGTGTTRRP